MPSQQEMATLVTLFNQQRYAETERQARWMAGRYPLHGLGWQVLGAVLKRTGRVEESLLPLRKAAELSPAYPEAHYNLGNTFKELGRLEEAATAYLQAIRIKADYAEAHGNLGATLKELGRLDGAEASCRRAIQIRPDYAEAHYNLGNVLVEQGKPEQAEDCYRRAIAGNPAYARAHCGLGGVLKALGRPGEAEEAYLEALRLKPDFAEAYFGLGNALREAGRQEEAVTCYRRAVECKPAYAEAHYNLGNLLWQLGRADEALAHCRLAQQGKPDFVEPYVLQGNILRALGQYGAAEASCRRALEIFPDHVDAHNNLGSALYCQNRFDEAMASYRRALEISPDFAEAHNNLANLYKDMGQHVEAAACYRKALELRPDLAEVHSNLIFSMDLSSGADMQSLFEERRKWGEMHADPLWRTPPHSNDGSPERRLRVGYVSADFRNQSASRVFGSMLTCYDREQFEVFAYFNYKGREDASTELFRRNVTAWRNIAYMPDEAVAELIREDGIDILVDLSGHMAGNRLLVFARKPAPVQVSAWGYACGTGMRAMDALLADPVMAPPEEKQYFVEDVRYLPCTAGLYTPETYPEVNELPALAEGSVTFGSLNRLAKATDESCDAWGEILRAVPGSRLLLKGPELSDPAIREAQLKRFAARGVAAERLILLGKTSWHEHMQAYNRIDFALDPFPHGGGVTTMEGLAMGVPALTLRWPTIAGRVSASIMTVMDMRDWIAESVDGYVELAIRKTSDLEGLAGIRRGLRQAFTASVIGDPVAYARVVEREYRQLWREWCARQSGEASN